MRPSGVADQGASYRNGLVLGLTMAEILLLLLFCMLIALGASMQSERKARKDVEERLAAAELTSRSADALAEAVRSNPQLREALEAGAGGASAPEVDRFWRKLVEGSAAADALERAGLPRERAAANASALAEADRAMRESGANPRDMARDAALAAKARKVLADKGLPTDDAKVLEATERGAGAIGDDAAGKVAAKGDGAGHKWPPIISLSEADGFYFPSGRAELDRDFAEKLSRVVVPKVVELAKQYDVDTIEIVGHTDEQPMGARSSNLDRGLMQVLRRRAEVGDLAPADNAGLGLARAVAVVSTLLGDKRLAAFRLLPLSGGPLVLNDQKLSNGTQSGDVRQRRRIEIRLRQSSPPIEPKGFGGILPSWIKLPSL